MRKSYRCCNRCLHAVLSEKRLYDDLWAAYAREYCIFHKKGHGKLHYWINIFQTKWSIIKIAWRKENIFFLKTLPSSLKYPRCVLLSSPITLGVVLILLLISTKCLPKQKPSKLDIKRIVALSTNNNAIFTGLHVLGYLNIKLYFISSLATLPYLFTVWISDTDIYVWYTV